MKRELFERIAIIVSSVCDISVDDLRSESKRAEFIEARTIFIWQANKYGFCVNDIARYINRKRSKSIYDYLANYRIYRQASLSFRLLSNEIDKKVSEDLS